MTERNNPWELLIKREDLKKAIKEHGYFISPWSFQPMLKELNVQVKGRAPQYLSINFWSQQSKTLTDNNFYVVRSGKGHFVIFDEDKFPRPYLNLRIDKTKEIPIEMPTAFTYLQKAFSKNTLENAALEQLRFYGVYNKLIKELFGDVEYHVGPRGNRNSRFDVYFRRIDLPEPQLIFRYEGQEELDYSLWTEDYVLVFEAKLLDANNGLDIGWHKLAYPSQRFQEYADLRIIPVYYLKRKMTIHLFVFPELEFHNTGVILNDESQFNPSHIFRVTLPTNSETKWSTPIIEETMKEFDYEDATN